MFSKTFENTFIIHFLFSIFYAQTSSKECNIEYLYQNVTNILFTKSPKSSILNLEMNISDYFENNKRSNKYCFNGQATCCKDELFDLLKVVTKPLLHELSGLNEVHKRVSKFIIVLKSRVLLLMNVFLYNIHKELSFRDMPFEKEFMKNLYKIIHSNIRQKLTLNNDLRMDIRESILGTLSLSKNEVMCISTDKYNENKMIYFSRKIGKIFENSILKLYQQSMRLESIISKMQDIDLSQECSDDLFKMVLCGVCSEQLDFTLHMAHNNQLNNVKICPKYCYNVIRKCMAFFLSLVKSLQFYIQSLLKFSKKYKKNLIENSLKFWTNENHSQTFTEFIKYMEQNSVKFQIGFMCQHPRNIKESFADNEYLLDDQDHAAMQVFIKCINEESCVLTNMSMTKLVNDVALSVDQLIDILKTAVNPTYFINNILASSCNNNRYDRCWNGNEIGQYHLPIIEFNLSEPKLRIPLIHNQKDKIYEISRFIFDEVKNLSALSFQESLTKPPIIPNSGVEGSGTSGNFDDEDIIEENRLINPLYTMNHSTRMPSIKEIQFDNKTEPETVLHQIPNEECKLSIKDIFMVTIVVLNFYLLYF